VKYSVCLECFFPDKPFHERIGEVARLGYRAVEFWFSDYLFDERGLTYGLKDFGAIAGEAERYGVEISDFAVNANEGWFGGSPVKAADRQVFLDRLAGQIEIAHKLRCKRLIICTGNKLDDVPVEEQQANLVAVMKEAAVIAERERMLLVIEALNTTVNHPGYFLDSSKVGFQIIAEINHPNVRLLYDIYHMQIMEGNLISTIRQNFPLIGHFHSAGNPGRNELFIGEINYPNILREIAALGYQGNFGLEYFPTMDSADSLRKVKAHLDTYRD
jgi:hydroxypyruvate isomerase